VPPTTQITRASSSPALARARTRWRSRAGRIGGANGAAHARAVDMARGEH